MKPKLLTRRRFLGRLLVGASAVAAAAAGDGFWLEPRNLVTERVAIRLKRLPEEFHGFRIVQISDLHFGPYLGRSGVERVVQMAISLQPNLVVLTGDFVSHPWGKLDGPEGAHHAEPCADGLAGMNVPMIAVLGNHDHWNGPEIVQAALKSRGIHVLRNQAFPLEQGKSRVWIAGVDDALVWAADLEQALRQVPQTEATLLLVHEPDFADHAARFPVDLQLSGHSHGGQVRIPGLGAPVLPLMAQKYPIGLNRVGNLQVYTNRGIGVINPPVRLNCPPEVTLVTLFRESAV